MKLEQLPLPGMGGAFELPLLSRPKYERGRKLTRKARWIIKIISPTGIPRNAWIEEISYHLKLSQDVSYSHTYIESMADIIIQIDSGTTVRTFYNLINKKLYVSIGWETDLVKLYQDIESSGGLTLD